MQNLYLPLKWHAIPGYIGYYEINELGTVRSIDRTIQTSRGPRHLKGQYQKCRISKEGYYEIRLCRSGVSKVFGLHRLLALTFLPKPHHKNEVNHKDGNKANNSLSNLEWVTHRENVMHAFHHGLYKTFGNTTKPVVDTCSGQRFPSAKEAANRYGLGYSALRGYLQGRRPNPTCLQYC